MSVSLLEKANATGAFVAIGFYLSAIAVFSLRLAGRPGTGFWLGIFELCLTAPLVWLLCTAHALSRPTLYYMQIGLMIAWLLLELVLDYILKMDFRQMRGLLIFYVTLFFAGSGGMLGVAFGAGKLYGILSVILFFAMAALAFIQRGVTGM